MRFLLIVACFVLSALFANADKTTRKNLKVKDKTFRIEKTIDDLDTIVPSHGMIELSGYEKPLKSSHESLFVTNETNRILKYLEIRLIYLDEYKRQLHQRDIWIECEIPPSETRQINFSSWDKQKTLYYILSPKPRRSDGTPYDIKTEIISAVFKQ